MRRSVVGAKLAVVALVAVALAGCERQRWTSELVTVNGAGSDALGNVEDGGQFSPDGTKIVFSTRVSGLGPTDTNNNLDVYVRDLVAGTTTLVSVNAAGTDSGNDYSWAPRFTPDGTKVAFFSAATDLHPIGQPGVRGIYLRDLEAGTTVPASLNNAGTELAEGWSQSFSPDGTKMLFVTTASWLGPPDGNSLEDVYVRDFTAGTTTLVSTNDAGTGALGYSYDATFSPDGTKVVFDRATQGLMMRDLVASTTTMLAAEASDHIFTPDGTKIAFTGPATDHGYPDTNNGHDAFVLDLTTGELTLVSLNAAGTAAGNAWSYAGWISPDGTKVVFGSSASDLVPTDTNGKNDLFLRDLTTGVTTLVSVNADGTDSGNGQSSGASVSPDGTRVAFTSLATDLGPKDTSLCTRYTSPRPPLPPQPYQLNCPDVFVRDLSTGVTSLVSSNAEGTDSANEESRSGAFSPTSSDQILLMTQASNFGPTDTNKFFDLYLAHIAE